MMDRYKYPRTYHLLESPGKTSDDKVIQDMSGFEGKEVVIALKMDGENCSAYMDGYVHARSVDSKNHESRNWVKNYFAGLIPQIYDFYNNESLRICGENLYAKHSIHYTNLESYFYLFNVWMRNTCASWGFTEILAKEFNIKLVPILYKGSYDDLVLKSIISTLKDGDEGFVMRTTDTITFSDWPKKVAKYVRSNHVQTDVHWMNNKIEMNILK